MANDPQTFAALKLAIEGWFHGNSEIAERAPEFIALAERRLNRMVFTPDRETTATLTAAATVSLPADFWGVKSLWIDADPKVVLDPLTIDELMQTYPAASTGEPGHYAIVGSTLYLGPSPDSAYSLKLAYWAKLTALSDSNTTNWLLTAAPDLYLAAALVEANLWFKDEERATMWNGRVQEYIVQMNLDGKRRQMSGPVRIRSAVVI